MRVPTTRVGRVDTPHPEGIVRGQMGGIRESGSTILCTSKIIGSSRSIRRPAAVDLRD